MLKKYNLKTTKAINILYIMLLINIYIEIRMKPIVDFEQFKISSYHYRKYSSKIDNLGNDRKKVGCL